MNKTWKWISGILTGGIVPILMELAERMPAAVIEMANQRDATQQAQEDAITSMGQADADFVDAASDVYKSSSDNAYLGYMNRPDMPDFSSDQNNPWQSFLNSKTGAGLTNNEAIKMAYQTWERLDAQSYNHNEAVDARMWEQYVANNKYQWETQSMQAAGINPAMAYGGGSLVPTNATGAAGSISPQSAPAAPNTGSLSGLVDVLGALIRMPLEMKKLNAEINSINAGTNKTKTETKVLDAKLPFEVENLKAQVRSSNLSSDAQEIINGYLDKQQEAELRMKNATAEQEEQAVKKMVKEIEKMDYEELTMVISWMETNERILTLQKQRYLTDTQMKELESLIRVNNATASKLNLDVSNYEDITVIGTASHNMKFGPFSVAEGQPITLAMLKAAREEHKSLSGTDEEDGPEVGDRWHKKRSKNGTRSGYDGAVYD